MFTALRNVFGQFSAVYGPKLFTNNHIYCPIPFKIINSSCFHNGQNIGKHSITTDRNKLIWSTKTGLKHKETNDPYLNNCATCRFKAICIGFSRTI